MDARDYAAMTGGAPERLTVEIEDADGYTVEHQLPQRWAVCPLCNGNGSHVNPSIDAHGLSPEDFAEDPDFAEDYFRGAYDQTCNECHGLRVVPEVDAAACAPELLAAYHRQQDELAEMYAIQEAERRMGA